MRDKACARAERDKTEWCWPEGPVEHRQPGGSLDALSRALIREDDPRLRYWTWSCVLRYEDDGAPRDLDEQVARGIRTYELGSWFRTEGASFEKIEPPIRPREFAPLSAARLAGVDESAMSGAVWNLLDAAGRDLDAIDAGVRT